jgi:putative GTP pyrophosphokinase
MDLSEFRAYLEKDRPAFERWGEFVLSRTMERIAGKSVSVQIATQRVKDVASALGKVARKGYSNPQVDMTDLVGVRIVVLLSHDLKTIADEIEAENVWSASRDRDPNSEISSDPERFGYQSMHFVVRAKEDMSFDNGVWVKAHTPCEVQVRTLLQHAYAEVVHDHIYKSAWKPPAKAARFVASSAALIETSDHLFCETMRLLEEDSRGRNERLAELMRVYAERIGGAKECDEKFNLEVIESLEQYIPGDFAAQVGSLLDAKPFLVRCVLDRRISDPFWAQPVALLAYLLVRDNDLSIYDKWPFASSHEALGLVYSDLGVSPRYH